MTETSDIDIFATERQRQVDRLMHGIGTLASLTRGAPFGEVAREINALKTTLDSVVVTQPTDTEMITTSNNEAAFMPWGFVKKQLQ